MTVDELILPPLSAAPATPATPPPARTAPATAPAPVPGAAAGGLPPAAEAPVRIAAVATALPGAPVDNPALKRHFGISEKWVDAFVGSHARHLAVDLTTGRRTHTLADLCAQAAAAALARADVEASDVDFVVLGTASPDELMPATVNVVADRLGVDQVPTYQLQSGCAGAVQALQLGAMLLRGGGHRVGLVIGGDVCVKHLRLDRDFAAL